MEAKRQILGVGENMGTEESKKIWEKNAQFWDDAMGDESNEFHREVVRPKVTELLSPDPSDYILDIACGNDNERLVGLAQAHRVGDDAAPCFSGGWRPTTASFWKS